MITALGRENEGAWLEGKGKEKGEYLTDVVVVVVITVLVVVVVVVVVVIVIVIA